MRPNEHPQRGARRGLKLNSKNVWRRPIAGALIGAAVLALTQVNGAASTSKLTISGQPAGIASVGKTFAFTPSVNRSSRDVRFSVRGNPNWLHFSSYKGTLYGVPRSSSVGTYSGIVITVSDGHGTATLAPISIAVAGGSLTANLAPIAAPTLALAPTPMPTEMPVSDSSAPAIAGAPMTGSARISWLPPTAKSDGSTLANLAGYHVWYGTSETELDKMEDVTNAGLTDVTIENLAPGTWYFSVKAYDSEGSESGDSPIGSKTIL